MKIELEKLIPQNWDVKNLDQNNIKVHYINKGRGHSPKPFILPKTIIIDKEFIEAAGMYLGDGKLSADLTHLGFSSIDKDMVKFILDFFMKIFGIQLEDMTISLRFKMFKKEVLYDWSRILKIPVSKIKIHESLRSRNESCEVQISGKIFRILFEKIIDEITSGNFLSNQELRRAFLRGIFAAEGSIAVNYQQNYIVCIQYCLCYYETDLADMIKKALCLEGITYKESKREKDKSLTIWITSWNNYHKCWKIDLFCLNQRKEFLFLNKLKVTKFSCRLNPTVKKRLFVIKPFSQRQLASLIGAYSNVLTNPAGIGFINIEYVIKLSKIASIPLEEVKNGMTEFRVNDVTPITDKEFIDFIFDLKSYCV